MKQFTKICLILCGVCLVLGILLLGVGSAMGANPMDYIGHVDRDYVDRDYIEEYDIQKHVSSADEKKAARPVTAPGEDGKSEYDQTFTEEIRQVHVSASFAQIQVYTHEEPGIRVVAENAGDSLRCQLQERERELTISDRRNNSQPELRLSLYLPEAELGELDLELGAGTLYAQHVTAREFDLEVGGGECVIENLTVKDEAGLHVGAGTVQINRFQGKHLDGECGAGELILGLAGVFEDYNYELDVPMGEIRLNQETYSGLANEKEIRNRAFQNVDLECAVGSIQIDFVE